MSRPKHNLVNLSVEEENLASIPFAVLERRVGKKTDKIEVSGTKMLPDGQELRVVWQVQGNSELGLPTEQDLDIFVALGVLTFQNNFQKTVSFSGTEMARILNIKSVHGKFYQRLKLAMDRFIPLRFRAIASTERQEDVKWLNVFQEASFSLDHDTGRCVGSVTWTDKLIQSMNSGFFRLLDSSRYMELDGITAKHLYRYLAVAFEKTDILLVDARMLATEHIGMVNTPKYFSRLMQTLEPALEQLIKIHVLGSYHVVSTEEWRIALHRHADYVSERKSLLESGETVSFAELQRVQAEKLLESAGLAPRIATLYAEAASTMEHFYHLQRAARLIDAMKEEGVVSHVAVSLVRKALDCGLEEGREQLDWCEMGVEVCREKQRFQQRLKNPAGLVVKIAKDAEQRERLVTSEALHAMTQRFRQREVSALRQHQDAEEQGLVLEYERFRELLAVQLLQDMPEDRKRILRREKNEILRKDGRLERIAPELREQQSDDLILQDLARTEAPPFEKWHLRQRAAQAMLPFEDSHLATA